ncbi:MAG: DUF1998 domain-containing protein [Geminicoccaceae bacterium]
MSQKPLLRRSQMITTFGPGAMVDLPTRSVLIGGLNRWPGNSQAYEEIRHERQLVRLLESWLREQGRLEPGQSITLRAPPQEPRDPRRPDPYGVEVTVFPRWFVCDLVERIDSLGRNGRRLVEWPALIDNGKRQLDIGGKKHPVQPVRFVGACPNGHIQDLDWPRLVHQGAVCPRGIPELWLIERGTSASLADLEIACSCGESRSINDLTKPGVLGMCRGAMPWIGPAEREACIDDQRGQPFQLRLLTRSATNAYFPLSITVISIPEDATDERDQLVGQHLDALRELASAAEIAIVRKSNKALDQDFKDVSNDEIFALVQQRLARSDAGQQPGPREREFEKLAAERGPIGENRPGSLLYAERLEPNAWGGPHRLIDSVVAVHRLREVMALFGFTRFNPPRSVMDDEFEEHLLEVKGAAIGTEISWLPAVEQFGEGLFIRFDDHAIAAWLDEANTDARARIASLLEGYKHHRELYPNLADPDPPGGPYYLLHTLSHALMIEIALECGYPQSSLKERIYAFKPGADGRGRYAILIYAVATGAQGTLGGLVTVAGKLAGMLDNAIERHGICSNDPVCSDHEPRSANDERALLGAACHGCLLVPETSCERRNQHLDRSLIVETMAGHNASI